MLIPKNHEKLQVISEIVADGFDRLERDGVPYYDDQVFNLARQAIETCMPELLRMSGEVMTIEAMQGISLLDSDNSTPFDGLHVRSVFKRVSIQQLLESATLDDVSLQTSTLDLCVVMTPAYVDPDPQDIVFGKELYVPFSFVTEFEMSEL
jgi:hypothetical protein